MAYAKKSTEEKAIAAVRKMIKDAAKNKIKRIVMSGTAWRVLKRAIQAISQNASVNSEGGVPFYQIGSVKLVKTIPQPGDHAVLGASMKVVKLEEEEKNGDHESEA